MKLLLEKLSAQIRLVYQLTFHPDLNSAVYLNRTRLNIATLSMLGLDALYAILWCLVFDPDGNKGLANSAFLICATGVSALAFINLHYRLIPFASQLAVVIFSLWLNIPVLAIYIYLVVDPPLQALANTIILLLLYTHIQDWRASLLGTILAAITAPCIYFLSFGFWPKFPPLLQLFMLSMVLGGGVIVAVSSANITKMRKRYSEKVLQVTQAQLRPDLQQQLELIGNMRYEARYLLQDEGQRLALDHLASEMASQVEQLTADLARLAKSQATGLDAWHAMGLLRSSDILSMAGNDLMANYHYDADFLDQVITPTFTNDVVIEANAAEASQALAALLAAMLTARKNQGLQEGLHLHYWEQGHIGKLRVSIQAPVDVLKPAHKTNVKIPPFTAYIYRLFHISWQVYATFNDGTPADIEFSCPLPSHSPSKQP